MSGSDEQRNEEQPEDLALDEEESEGVQGGAAVFEGFEGPKSDAPAVGIDIESFSFENSPSPKAAPKPGVFKKI